MVIVFVPVVALEDAVTFIVVLPAAESELGVKVIVVPLPWPDAVKLTAPVTVPLSVIVELLDDPLVTDSEFGDAEIE